MCLSQKPDSAEMNRKVSVENYGNELAEIFTDKTMVVFLCGPTLSNLAADGAKLRKDLMDALTAENFEVVLGEDDGLEHLRDMYGHYAHDNELQFIQSQCNAVVLIASSPGALCELGLFAYDHAHSGNSTTDFILILDEKYSNGGSYISEGPAMAINDFGKVFHGDLKKFDFEPIIGRLRRRRAAYFTDKRGRPPAA